MIAVLFSFGAGIAGFALGSMIFGFAGSFQISVTLFVLSFGISYVILGIRTVVCCVILRKNINKALAVRNEKGYCDEYYSLLEKQCHKGNYKKRFYSLITYAGELADGERLEQAREVVGHIDTSRADRRMVAEYANAFIYICLMSGKYELANIIARGGQNILEEYAENSERHSWMHVNEDNGMQLPRLEGLAAAACGDVLVAIGGRGLGTSHAKAYSQIYVSQDNGLTWSEDGRFYLPAGFNGTGAAAAMAVDNKGFIWIICGGTGEVWRGRLNRMGWADQKTSFTE